MLQIPTFQAEIALQICGCASNLSGVWTISSFMFIDVDF